MRPFNWLVRLAIHKWRSTMPFNKLTWLVRLAIHKCRSTTITFDKLTTIGMVVMHVYLRWFRK